LERAWFCLSSFETGNSSKAETKEYLEKMGRSIISFSRKKKKEAANP